MASDCATRNERLVVLDGLRGVAALCVVVMHVNLWFLPPERLRGAALAVDFFFCLSGFVIAHAYAGRFEQGLQLRRFLLARLRRLYPLLLAGFVAGALVAVLSTTVGGEDVDTSVGEVLSSFTLSLLMIPHENPRLGYGIFPLDSATWSLFFELLANGVFGIAMVWLGARRARWLFGLLVLAASLAALRYSSILQGFTLDGLGLGILRVGVSFFMGVLLHQAQLHERIARRVRSDWAFVVLSAVLLGAFLIQSIWHSLGWELFCVLVVLPGVVLTGSLSEPRNTRLLQQVAGEISYPLYILHGPLIVGAVGALKLLPVFSGPSDLRLLALAVLGSIVGSWVVLKVYDEPVRAWLARRTKRRVLAAA